MPHQSRWPSGELGSKIEVEIENENVQRNIEHQKEENTVKYTAFHCRSTKFQSSKQSSLYIPKPTTDYRPLTTDHRGFDLVGNNSHNDIP
ncbi:MAG: hypothetical protein WBA61_04795 [Aequorivita sp.]